jgi:plastocyanin
MIGDEKGFRFEPAQLTVAPGDRINFVMVSGGPHNVQFEADKIGDAGERALRAVMRDTIADLTSQMYMNEGETYTLTMTNVPAGSYPYVCTPHAAMGMRGTITVRGGAGGAKPAAARRPARKGS